MMPDDVLQVALTTATLASQTTPIKRSHEILHDRFDRVESLLTEFQAHKKLHAGLEERYDRARTELFGGGGGGRRLRTPRQLRVANRLASPKRERNKHVSDGIAKKHHDYIVDAARERPGVHATRPVGSTLDTRGGSFSTAFPKSDLEMQLLRSSFLPAPNLMLPSTLDRRGVIFQQAKLPSTDMDLQIARGASLPAPNAYDTRPVTTAIARGKFNSKSKRLVERMVHEATLNHGSDPLLLPSTLSTSGGNFNKSKKPLTEIDWAEKRAKQIPAPGSYRAKVMDISNVQGGKISRTSTLSDIEWAEKRARQLPGPGDYRVVEAMEASSAHKGRGKGGKFSFVYRPLDFERRSVFSARDQNACLCRTHPQTNAT